MIAGTSQPGRSPGSRSEGRATEGWRAGALGGTVDVAASGAAVTVGAVAAGSPPGVQAGVATGVQVCWAEEVCAGAAAGSAASCCRRIGLLLISQSISAPVRRAGGWVL